VAKLAQNNHNTNNNNNNNNNNTVTNKEILWANTSYNETFFLYLSWCRVMLAILNLPVLDG